MKNFKIAQPIDFKQAAHLLALKKPGFYPMAGGTDLLDEIKNHIISPEAVVDLTSIPNMSFIQQEKNSIRIGALTSVNDLIESKLIETNYSVLHQAALSLATPQLRNVGTIGGNLCQRPRCWYYRDPQILCWKKGGEDCFAYSGKNKYHAIFGGEFCFIVHPSDLAPALICLDAEVVIVTADKEKKVKLADFYHLPQENKRGETILEPGELLKEIIVPLSKNGEKSIYLKIKERSTWDFAVVSAAVKGKFSGNRINDIRIVLGGVAPVPWRLEKAEKYLKGKNADENSIRAAAREGLKDAASLEENAYKKDLVEAVLVDTIIALSE